MYRIMKNTVAIFIIVVAVNFSMAYAAVRPIPKGREDETLITRRTIIGAYIAPVIKLSRLNHELAVLAGGHGGLIFNRSFVIGLGAYGLVNEIEVNTQSHQLVDFGYAGLLLGYVNRSHKIIHVSVHSLIGGGGLRYRTCFYDDWYDDMLLVFEPSVDVEVNVTKHFRIGLGGSYRFAHGVEFDGLVNDDINGPSGALTFKCGVF
jgi:hypothetical protein